MMAFLARLALGGLLKAGVSEGFAGKFVLSWPFKVLAGVVLVCIAAFVGWLSLLVHDRHVTTVATVRCEAENLVKALGAENEALKKAAAQMDDALRKRGLALERNQSTLISLKEKNDALRNQSPGPGRLVFDADDPWVRALVGSEAHRPDERAGRSGPR